MAINKKSIIGVLIVTFVIILCVGYCYPKYKEHLRWKNYFDRTSIGNPNKLVSNFFEAGVYQEAANITILDLGAGNGNDSIFLLNKGYSVYAVDFQDESITRIRSKIREDTKQNIKLIKSSFQNIEWQTLPKFDVIIAINSISFINEDDFNHLWSKIINQLKPNGVLITRLFGSNLSWPNMENMTLLDKSQVTKLTNGLEVIQNNEEFYEENGLTQHAYNLILKKNLKY